LKIGFDARLISSLGIGRYISGLLPALAQRLGDRLVVFSRRADLALLRALTSGHGRLVVSEAAPYRAAEQSAFLLTLLRLRLALMHFPHYNLPLAYPGRFVVTIHDLFSFDYPEIHSGKVPRTVNRVLIANAVRRATAIITPSQATAAALVRRFPSTARRVTAIPEATEARFTSARNPAGEAAWQRYLGIRSPYLLYLGQWKAYKNVPQLIDAFSRVLRQRPDLQLVIAGGDPRHPEVEAMARSLPPGSVVLPGHLPDDAVADVYRAAAAVVIPSRAEGFGLPVLEAMACAVPVVCSDIPVLHEIADGVAIFADPNSADSFATAMLAALDPAGNAGRLRDGLERAQRFSWQRAAEETIAVYERALAGRARTRSETD
jgi:glycosyltransferase involved in cell wall biosynthesis